LGHHYVPQYLLRGFAEDNGVWCFDMKLSTARRHSPQSIANESKMYGASLESELANTVEGPANPVIEKLRSRLLLSDEERIVLARYIAVLWKRVPKARSRAASHLPVVAEEVRRRWHVDMETIARENPSQRDLLEQRKVVIDRTIDNLSATLAPEAWLEGLKTPQSDLVMNAILGMHWCLVNAQEGDWFISDDPVFIYRERGVGQPHSELFLPVSSKVAIRCDRKLPSGMSSRNATSAEVRALNRRTVGNATRFVFAQRRLPWTEEFIQRWRPGASRANNA
jgi:hypothetical protein